MQERKKVNLDPGVLYDATVLHVNPFKCRKWVFFFFRILLHTGKGSSLRQSLFSSCIDRSEKIIGLLTTELKHMITVIATTVYKQFICQCIALSTSLETFRF